MSSHNLTATYNSTESAKKFSFKLPSLPRDGQAQDVKNKTGYLSALRANIGHMQSDVNAFLTQKMEEDKATEAGTAKLGNKTKEEKEEQMYGEEDPENEG